MLSVTTLLIKKIMITFVSTQSVYSKEKTGKQTLNSMEAKAGDSVKCPVMGKKITVGKDSSYAVVDGKKYYVCCGGCTKKIEENPGKYLEAKAGDEVCCPVKGKKFTIKKKSKYAKIDGKKYYVCCNGCVGKLEKDPEKYLKEKSNKKKMMHKDMDHSGCE